MPLKPLPMQDLDTSQVRSVDAWAASVLGLPGMLLMENAGRSVAEVLASVQTGIPTDPVVILCGPGNNGGDGFVVARHLDGGGWPVQVLLATDPNRLKGDALFHWEILKRTGVPILAWEGPAHGIFDPLKHWVRVSWFVDALFGTGLTRAIGEPFAGLINSVNRSGTPVIAVDLPSGLDADAGVPLGPTIRAIHTVAMVAGRKGFAVPGSREYTGQIHIGGIGLPAWKMEIAGPALVNRN